MIPAFPLGKLRRDGEFEISLGYMVRSFLTTTTKLKAVHLSYCSVDMPIGYVSWAGACLSQDSQKTMHSVCLHCFYSWVSIHQTIFRKIYRCTEPITMWGWKGHKKFSIEHNKYLWSELLRPLPARSQHVRQTCRWGILGRFRLMSSRCPALI